MFPALLLLTLDAAAVEVPVFDAEQHVYRVPASLSFPTERILEAIEATQSKPDASSFLEQPDFRVVIYEQVEGGALPRGASSHTEAAIDAIWAAWSGLEGFDAEVDFLVVLSLDEREVRGLAGTRWDQQLGLQGAAIERVIDTHFMPHARSGSLDAALAHLVTGFDQAVIDGLARARQAEERARRAETRRQELALQQREQRLAREREELRRHQVRVQRAEQLGTVALAGSGGLFFLSALGGAGIGIRRLRSPRRRAREAHAETVALWRERLEHAEGVFAAFRVDTEVRDRILELRLKGCRTLEVCEEVGRVLDEIQVGLQGLRRHVEACARVEAPRGLSPQPWAQALERLESPFQVDPDQVPERLFPSEQEARTIDPGVFAEELDERFDHARTLWTLVKDAVAAAGRTARADLPAEGLHQAQALLIEAELPDRWLRAHPLKDDAEGTWGALDGLRVADPVAYLEALEEAVVHAEEAEEDVQRVVDALRATAEAREEAAAVVIDHLDTLIPESHDPEPPTQRAEEAVARAWAEGRAARTVQAVEEAAEAAITAFQEARSRREAIVEAVESAEATVGRAAARVEALKGGLGEAQARARELLPEHQPSTMQGVWQALTSTTQDVEEAEAALARAREQLAAREHVLALASALEAKDEHQQALASLQQLTEAVASLVAVRDDFTRQKAALDKVRADHLAVLASIGDQPTRLDTGDELRLLLATEVAQGGPADWASRLATLQSVLASWQQGVDAAVAEHQERQRQLARQRAAAAASHRASMHARRHSSASRSSRRSSSSYSSVRSSSRRSSTSSSWRSSSSSSRSRSGGSSFGSSRSGGRSFGSSRSGGRSFGGSRSGGRRF